MHKTTKKLNMHLLVHAPASTKIPETIFGVMLFYKTISEGLPMRVHSYAGERKRRQQEEEQAGKKIMLQKQF